ncbi:semaphorin-1A-like isoform X2 [Clytia hemisphaerica]|uniref:semaphorin-1A-like isoform X2 n=1 Tax=Clytia hemisphaerica TaxID=252671 RepID=UPI0034D7A19A
MVQSNDPKFIILCFFFTILYITHAENVKVIHPVDQNIVTFPSESTPDFKDKISQVKTIVKLEDNSIVIGAVNMLAKFSSDLKLIKSVKLEPSDEDISKCGDVLEKCQNNILSLVIGENDHVHACGTYAKQPGCWTFDQDLKEVSVKKYRFLPTLSNTNLTVMYTGLGSSYLYAHDKIYKDKTIKTADTNLNKVNFVSSLEYNEYTYFFLREVAEGGDNRKHIYSRVARLCKYEEMTIFYDQFNSFLKSQLICKKEGTLVPVYYDEIQATTEVRIGDEVYIYAVFSTSSEIGSDSALCRYNMKDISDTFYYSKMSDSTGKSKDGVDMSETRNKISRQDCNVNFTSIHSRVDQALVGEVSDNALLFQQVQPKTDKNEALFTLSTRFSSISSDQIKDNETGEITTVLFVGSVDGQVYKIVVENDKPRLVEKIRPFKTQGPIYKVEVYDDMVYTGGPNGVAAFGVERCTSNVLCPDCLSNKDPYCGWVGTSCVLASTSNIKRNVQEASQCPKVPTDFKCSVTTVQPGVLECNIIKPSNNGPVPSILNWKLGGSDILGHGQDYSVTIDKSHSTLIIRNLTMDSRGNYKCVIGNADHKTYCAFELDDGTIIKPSGAPVSQDAENNYFMAFIGTLILLLIILLILLAIVLYRHRRRRAARSHDTDSPKKTKITNGVLSPKKQKYDISKNDKPPEVCIEMKEEAKLLPKDDSSPVLANGGDNKNDEKSEQRNNEEKSSLIVDT